MSIISKIEILTIDDKIIEIINAVSINTQMVLLNNSNVFRPKLSINVVDKIVTMKFITPAPRFPY